MKVRATGDRRLARALREAAADNRPVQRFTRMLPEHGIDPDFYLLRSIPREELLPWDAVSFSAPTRENPPLVATG